MKTVADIPGPPKVTSLPMAWTLFQQVRRDVLGTLDTAFREFGDVFKLEVFGRKQIFVRSPDLIREILVDHPECFAKGLDYTDRRKGIARFAGAGLLTSNGEFWRRQRKIVAPALHTRGVARYLEVMVDQTDKALSGWQPGASVVLDNAMMALSLHIVGASLFHADVHGEVEGIAQSMNALHGMVAANNSPATLLPAWFPTPQRRREARSIRALDEIIYRLIHERRVTETAEVRAVDDLATMLLTAEDDQGKRMTDTQVRDEIVTLFLAGHETSANALTWAFLLLAKTPETESRLQAEADAVLGKRRPTLDDLKQLPYAEAVAKEALRLYPPAFTFQRTCTQEAPLGEYLLAPGVDVSLVPYATHRDPRFFQEPESFRPERFLPDAPTTIHRFAWIPFGAGPRVCVGNTFALMEMTLVLTMVASRFSLRPLRGHPAPAPALTLRPSGPVEMAIATRYQT